MLRVLLGTLVENAPGCTSDIGPWPTPFSSTVASRVTPFIRKMASFRVPGSVGSKVTGTVQVSDAPPEQLTAPSV
jgi:hypothetical protein